MIVHVWRRARAAEAGRVVVAADTEEILQAVRSAGGEAVLTRSDHASGSDRIFEALNHVDPDGEAEFVVNLQGDLPTLDAHLVRECLSVLATKGPDIATLAAEITEPENAPIRTSSRWSERRSVATPNAYAHFISLAPRHPTATARFTITSAFTVIGARRLSASSRCRRRRSRSGSVSSSCGPSNPACASMWPSLTRSPSVSILRPTLSGPAASSSLSGRLPEPLCGCWPSLFKPLLKDPHVPLELRQLRRRA